MMTDYLRVMRRRDRRAGVYFWAKLLFWGCVIVSLWILFK